MISIVVPIYNCKSFTKDFLESVKKATTYPGEIIFIDNASTDDSFETIHKYMFDLPIRYIRNAKNIGVNRAWMQGYEESSGEFIGFWNNDIKVCSFIFDAIGDIFLSYREVGYLVPEVVNNDFLVDNAIPFDEYELEDIYEREGWCFTMRKEIIDKGGKIPYELINSAGDDWLYNITRDQGYDTCRMKGVTIKHWGSATISDMGGWKYLEENTCPNDLRNWERIKREKRW